MRWLVMSILMIALVTTSVVDGLKHYEYSTADHSDEYLYDFFSNVLDGVERSIDLFLHEDANALNESIRVSKIDSNVWYEWDIYKNSGLGGNLSSFRPFSDLCVGAFKLCNAQSEFLKNIKNDYVKSRCAVVEMYLSIEKMEKALDKIEEIKVWNGSSYLHFDTSDLRSKLKDAKDLVEYYDGVLASKEALVVIVLPKKNYFEESEIVNIFFKNISKTKYQKTYVHENVLIFVHAKKIKPTHLFINSKRYEITNKKMEWRFNKTGIYTIYAEGLSGNKTVRSNVVRVEVLKIPTRVIIKPSKTFAFVKEVVRIEGWVEDINGNRLDANTTVLIDGKIRELKSPFVLNVTKMREGYLNLTISYNGDETHEKSSANVSVFFSRYPVKLWIKPEKESVFVGEKLKFIGYISIQNASITVYVNSTPVKIINVSDEFEFSLVFSRVGNHTVYAYYVGNETYKQTRSNTVVVTVEEGLNLTVIFIAIPSFFGLIYLISHLSKRFRRRKTVVVPSDSTSDFTFDSTSIDYLTPTLTSTDSTSDTPHLKDVSKIYGVIFKGLVEMYNLSVGLTPRELLEKLNSKDFSDHLRVVTEIHEKFAYAELDLSEEEIEAFTRSVNVLMEVIG